jgi:hypothetical protein
MNTKAVDVCDHQNTKFDENNADPSTVLEKGISSYESDMLPLCQHAQSHEL